LKTAFLSTIGLRPRVIEQMSFERRNDRHSCESETPGKRACETPGKRACETPGKRACETPGKRACETPGAFENLDSGSVK